MTSNKLEWKDPFIHLLALASRLEGEGQYNIAKLARAAADSISHRAAYQLVIPTDKYKLASDVKQTTDALSSLDVGEDFLVALKRGADTMSEGRPPRLPSPHLPQILWIWGRCPRRGRRGSLPLSPQIAIL